MSIQIYLQLLVKRPKHFYVDLKDSKGIMHKHVYVSKHCNSWREVQIGSQIILPVVTTKMKMGFLIKLKLVVYVLEVKEKMNTNVEKLKEPSNRDLPELYELMIRVNHYDPVRHQKKLKRCIMQVSIMK